MFYLVAVIQYNCVLVVSVQGWALVNCWVHVTLLLFLDEMKYIHFYHLRLLAIFLFSFSSVVLIIMCEDGKLREFPF